jgi:hypothetical protein
MVMNELQRLEEAYAKMGRRIEELKSKKELPKSWEELGGISGCFVDFMSCLSAVDVNVLSESYNKNVFATKEQAKASIAIAQLSQLMKVYNGDWVPDWKDYCQKKYVIFFSYDQISSDWIESLNQFFLAFKTPELRDEFLKNFHDLIMEAKPLL